MNIISTIRRWFHKMFLSNTDIGNVFDVDVAVNAYMLGRIDLWRQMYSGCAVWVTAQEPSLRLEQAVTREFANITLNEMTAKVTNKKLNEIYKKAVRNLNENLQAGLATGALIIKPLGADKVQYVAQDNFIPVEYDDHKRLVKVIFPEIRQVGEYDYYIRLEYHSLSQESGLTIENRAFHSSSADTLGKACKLSCVEDWAELPEIISYPLMKRQAFGYYRNPLDNTIDESSAGISIFDPAAEIIEKTDKLFGRLDWEFESGERAIHVDDGALVLAKNSANEQGFELPKTFDRLYRGLNIEQGLNTGLFQEFSPQLRQADFIAGLDEYKRMIEFAVCLSYGDISNPQSVEKTAEEVRIAKKRKYNMVTAIQENLRDCLDDLVYALAFYNSMATVPYEFICDFKDSILTDEGTERKQDLQDVSVGAMQLWEYRMKWYNEDEETAKKMVTAEADVIDDDAPVTSKNVNPQSETTTEVQGKSLNGAQTQSLIAIMAQFSSKQITEGQAVNLISTAIGISKDEAKAILNGDLE